jgi:hypothetical protein
MPSGKRKRREIFSLSALGKGPGEVISIAD